MSVPLWKWDVVQAPQGGICGVSGSPHGAMEALSLALIETAGVLGEVTPVTLTDIVIGYPFYLQSGPKWHAKYSDGVITWRAAPCGEVAEPEQRERHEESPLVIAAETAW